MIKILPDDKNFSVSNPLPVIYSLITISDIAIILLLFIVFIIVINGLELATVIILGT